jgi:hypothetical protein
MSNITFQTIFTFQGMISIMTGQNVQLKEHLYYSNFQIAQYIHYSHTNLNQSIFFF